MTILQQDIKRFAAAFPFREEIRGSTVLVTGATGLIGLTLVRCLLGLNEQVSIIAPVRNKAKFISILGEEANSIRIIECDLMEYDFRQAGHVDYIFHCAAPTASSFFVSHPVETAKAIYTITDHILNAAIDVSVRGIVYLSSLEVYGSDLNSEHVTEDMQGYWNPLDVRSSYPIAKRAAENLCCLYATEYHIPVRIARLTQTTGAGINMEDNRIINQFARLAYRGEDIILHSTGESARPYCYTIDCILGLFYILMRGENGAAYNVANPDTYISARDMALFIRDHFAPQIAVRIEINDNMGYAPASRLNLSTDRLQQLGWRPIYGLKEIIQNVIQYYNEIG